MISLRTEQMAVMMLAAGYRRAEVARALHLDPKTVDRVRERSIYRPQRLDEAGVSVAERDAAMRRHKRASTSSRYAPMIYEWLLDDVRRHGRYTLTAREMFERLQAMKPEEGEAPFSLSLKTVERLAKR